MAPAASTYSSAGRRNDGHVGDTRRERRHVRAARRGVLAPRRGLARSTACLPPAGRIEHLGRGPTCRTQVIKEAGGGLDRNCQYTSAEFARFCADTAYTQAVGRTGVCSNNVAAESFFATLKIEMYHRRRVDTRAKARFAVAEYIEIFYSRQRLHSSLGYRTPAEALADHQARAAAA